MFSKVKGRYDSAETSLVKTKNPTVLRMRRRAVAVGQRIPSLDRARLGHRVREETPAAAERRDFQSSLPNVFFARLGLRPKNIIWAVPMRHEAAVSIDLLFEFGKCFRKTRSPHEPDVPEDGIHEWSYDNEIATTSATGAVADVKKTLKNVKMESSSASTAATA